MIPVPVIMYHAVGPVNHEWIWRHLVTPVEVFEGQIKALAEKGFKTITLRELYDYMQYNKVVPENSIVLTFDDGYLDNWVYAFPVLKKYGMKGTIYVNPEFVDPSKEPRPNLEYVWKGECKEDELPCKGFLAWPEMLKMEEAGVMDIQAHSMSHTWFFCGDEIVDFHRPGCDQYPWLFWNARPDRKSYYMNEDQEHFVPYGTPIYRHGRSLGIRRYFEDRELTRHVVDFVKVQSSGFFNRKDWKQTLMDLVERYKSENKLNDRFETDDEMHERFRYELVGCRDILEAELAKKVEFLCWAGGAFNEAALNIANEAGYLSSTVFYNDIERKNVFGEDPSRINRTGCVSEFNWKNKFITFTDPGFFIANIKKFSGDKTALWIMRLYKIKYLLRFYIKILLKRGELL